MLSLSIADFVLAASLKKQGSFEVVLCGTQHVDSDRGK